MPATPGQPLRHLPLIPEPILRRHRVFEPSDTRFRACARLLQALWREQHQLPIGTHASPDGTRRKLGSRLSPAAGRSGANFLSPAVAALTRREVAYREVGAFIHEQRLWTNLLSSEPLTFNLFGPLRLDLPLASRALRLLCPDLGNRRAAVRAVWFEHAPGRGASRYTGDHTAFDVLLGYDTPQGRTGFVAVEVKYAEACQEPAPELKARYGEIAPGSGLFVEPLAPALRRNPCQQFFRQHCLAHTMVQQGLYEEGRFVVIAPALNHSVQSAVRTYQAHLAQPRPEQVGFVGLTLEEVITALGRAGAPDYARALYFRYLDWWAVDRALSDALAVPTSCTGREAESDPAESRPTLALLEGRAA
jgi:hypothetical protein